MITEFIISYGTLVAFILRILSSIQVLVFVTPLQLKEYSVQNGLIPLRRQLLIFGLILFSINIVTTFFLLEILRLEKPQPLINATLQVFNAFGFFAASTIGVKIYNSQYNEESKSFHEKRQRGLL